jgi:hypothetical protein
MTSEEIAKIQSMTPADKTLPITFKNGSKISKIWLSCGKCGGDVEQQHIHGDASFTNEHTIAYSGFGLCYACKTVTPLECRIIDDGTFLLKNKDGWSWNRITRDDPGLVVIAWRYLRSLVAGRQG